MKPMFVSTVSLSVAACSAFAEPATPANSKPETRNPNIIYILADDLGYGDVQCLNPKHGKIKTPNLDKFAAQGMIFTDAHGTSSVCTPTRYSILTGRYNWRSSLQQGVLGVFADAPLIAKDRLTAPRLLKQSGYTTACIGKWHLSMNFPFASAASEQRIKNDEHKRHLYGTATPDDFDWSKPITDGPITRGFDYFYGMNAPGIAPHCFIENDRTVGIPSAIIDAKEITKDIGGHSGPALPGWKQADILPALTDKSCEYIRQQAKTERPFFLYYALSSPHAPIAPSKEWVGKSGLGKYADFVMETDAMVGRVMEAIEQSGIADNTLVIFSSDNGCSPIAGIPALQAKGHFPSAQFRGHKADAWDGGHRVPFIVRWPGVVKPGSTCNQLACQMDLMATVAEITGAKIPETAGEDSFSLLPLFKGEDKPVRETLVHHSYNGRFAIREGNWKLLVCPGSGGWSKPNDAEAKKRKLSAVQLYDMSVDEGERKNLQAQHPEIVARLKAKLEQIVADGRSTPGAKQKNDVPVKIVK